MTTFNKTVLEFNSLLSQQKYLEALAFYADDIVSTDNLHSPITGIAALKTKTEDFIRNTKVHTVEVVSLMMENNLSATNWYHALEHSVHGKINGHRFSVQRWKDNKIIQENHFYSELR